MMPYVLEEGRTAERVLAMALAMLFGLMVVLILFGVRLVPITCGQVCTPGEQVSFYAVWAATLAVTGGFTYAAYGQIERPQRTVLAGLSLVAAVLAAGAFTLLR